MTLRHRETWEVIIEAAVERWNSDDPAVRQPHDSGLIVMGALIEKVDAIGGNGARRFKHKVQRAALPIAGGTGLGGLLLIELIRAL